MTRWLLTHLAAADVGFVSLIRIFGLIGLDLLAAGVLLLGLALLLANGIEWMNVFSDLFGISLVEWRSMALDALDFPFTKGFMITMMLLSTLVPTALHLFMGLGAVFYAWMPGRVAAIDYLEDVRKKGCAARQVSQDQKVILVIMVAYLPGLILVPLLFLCVFKLFGLFKPYGQFLFDLANCATAWSHGFCALTQ